MNKLSVLHVEAIVDTEDNSQDHNMQSFVKQKVA